ASKAEIIAIGALIAGDPALSAPAVAAVQDGTDAVTAVREAAEGQAAMMEQLDNPALAARAGDIRAGGASSHAALVARGLGVPMIAGASRDVLGLADGQDAVVDGTVGELLVGGQEMDDARRALDAQASARGEARVDGPARTADGHQIVVLCNVAS